MRLITSDEIKQLRISPAECVEWVRESFALKVEAQLPPKSSVHPQGIDFFTTMPCLLPQAKDGTQRFGVKVIHRIEGAVPSLGSDIMLYDANSGELLAIVDGDWITTMRTGAVAALAVETFATQKTLSGNGRFAFIGLGNTARATLLCLLSQNTDRQLDVTLVRYKNQAELFMQRFADYENIRFYVAETAEEAISKADVIVSCVTQANELICPNEAAFRKGCLLLPVHTRGFQNCDLTFDKVFADDTAHVCNFKYFNQFRYFAEIQDVISGASVGRSSDDERIISYNIGLGLHDVLFASKIYDATSSAVLQWNKVQDKFWV